MVSERRPHWDDEENTKPLDPEFCRQITQSERWLSKVQPDDSGCLVWVGARNPGGYGNIRAAGKTWLSHRVAFVAASGTDIPTGMPLDHLCRNRACVNPDHLEVVTGRENTLRGTNPFAEGRAKNGWRVCRQCHRIDGRRQSALISAAKNQLGLSWRQYVAVYGQSSGAAKAVLTAAGIDPLSVLEGL